MKTTILNLMIVTLLLSSCNMGKYYANMRVGGKSNREEKTATTENTFVIKDSLIPDEELCLDTVAKILPATTVQPPIIKSNVETGKEIVENVSTEKVEFSESRSGKKYLASKPEKEKRQVLPVKKMTSVFFPASSMKYYGGISVKAYFWIGLGIILLAVLVMALIGASDLGWTIIMTALAAHLAISVMAAIVVGFMSLFPGMTSKPRKKKKVISRIFEPHLKKQGVDAEDIIYFLGSALLIAIGVLTLIASGISLMEIIVFVVGLALVVVLLYYLGELFMSIFPGMSFKGKQTYNSKKK